MEKITLRILRKKNNKTCAEVAKKLGASLRAYLRYEKGDKLLGIEQIFILSNLYEVTTGRVLEATINSTQQGACFEKTRPIHNKRLYRVFSNMKQRCFNSKCPDYKHYGGRGITICDEWRYDFACFQAWAIKSGYDENAKYGECTIDRIDVNGNYEPSNCRWVSMIDQNWNKK